MLRRTEIIFTKLVILVIALYSSYTLANNYNDPTKWNYQDRTVYKSIAPKSQDPVDYMLEGTIAAGSALVMCLFGFFFLCMKESEWEVNQRVVQLKESVK